jgi:hypothetical protein
VHVQRVGIKATKGAILTDLSILINSARNLPACVHVFLGRFGIYSAISAKNRPKTDGFSLKFT